MIDADLCIFAVCQKEDSCHENDSLGQVAWVWKWRFISLYIIVVYLFVTYYT